MAERTVQWKIDVIFTRLSKSRCVHQIKPSYLFTVKAWRAGCCLGIQMILGELRLGLPRPELLILLVLPLMPRPCPTWEWFSMFLVFIGKDPLLKETGKPLLVYIISLITSGQCLISGELKCHEEGTCSAMEEYGGTWWGHLLWG